MTMLGLGLAILALGAIVGGIIGFAFVAIRAIWWDWEKEARERKVRAARLVMLDSDATACAACGEPSGAWDHAVNRPANERHDHRPVNVALCGACKRPAWHKVHTSFWGHYFVLWYTSGGTMTLPWGGTITFSGGPLTDLHLDVEGREIPLGANSAYQGTFIESFPEGTTFRRHPTNPGIIYAEPPPRGFMPGWRRSDQETMT